MVLGKHDYCEKQTYLVVDEGRAEDVGQEDQDLVLRVFLRRCSDITFDAVNCLPFSCKNVSELHYVPGGLFTEAYPQLCLRGGHLKSQNNELNATERVGWVCALPCAQ